MYRETEIDREKDRERERDTHTYLCRNVVPAVAERKPSASDALTHGLDSSCS